ncbi:Protein CBG27945 [Caenorhabditis briggsae]|uniref:Protein CBG27945 n=1 Tax=Caenorhabditis briggsae TaxID=6238 RepID=B6IJN7_CAEBR|nr:Protein CBG27945 [Caenorhabditis briggsae]CAS00117.1 Protein CBG27945 [Caenorhabditis briggsae]
MMLAQPKSAGDFNERRFILLLNDLTEGRNTLNNWPDAIVSLRRSLLVDAMLTSNK